MITLRAFQSVNAIPAGGAGGTDRAALPLNTTLANGTPFADFPLRAGRAPLSARSLQTIFPGCPPGALGSLRTLRTFFSLGAFLTLRSLRTFRPLRTLRALGTF